MLMLAPALAGVKATRWLWAGREGRMTSGVQPGAHPPDAHAWPNVCGLRRRVLGTRAWARARPHQSRASLPCARSQTRRGCRCSQRVRACPRLRSGAAAGAPQRMPVQTAAAAREDAAGTCMYGPARRRPCRWLAARATTAGLTRPVAATKPRREAGPDSSRHPGHPSACSRSARAHGPQHGLQSSTPRPRPAAVACLR